MVSFCCFYEGKKALLISQFLLTISCIFHLTSLDFSVGAQL